MSTLHGPLTRDLLALTGSEVTSFMNGLLTADVEKLSQDHPCQLNGLLTPQGKIIDLFFLWRREDGYVIDAAPGRGATLLKKFTLYKLRADVSLTDVTLEMSVGVGDPPNGNDAYLASKDPRHGALPPRWIGPGAEDTAVDRGLHQAELHLGIPSYGTAFGEAEVFPLDVNLDALGGIDHKKGCFVGQEVASRMFRKGSIRKRTWKVSGPALEKGADLALEGKTVGTVLDASGEDGVALVRIDRLPPDATSLQVSLADGTPVTLSAPDYVS